MAKVNIKDFKGIITNIDENDLSLEASRFSVNFKFENNYADIDFVNFVKDTDIPDLENGYTWEKGTSAILASDILSEADTSFTKEIIFISAIKKVRGIYKRIFYIKIDDEWKTNTEINDKISNTILNTKIEGKIFFANEDGRLKIYLPHVALWLGYIDRKLYIPGEKVINKITIEKLVEKYSFSLSNTHSEGGLNPGYRLGIKNSIARYTASSLPEGKQVRWDFVGHNIDEIERGDQYSTLFSAYKLIDVETGIAYPAPGEMVDKAIEYELEFETSLEETWWFLYDEANYIYWTPVDIFHDYVKKQDSAIDFDEGKITFTGYLKDVEKAWATSPKFIYSEAFREEWGYIGNINPKINGAGFDSDYYEVVTTMVLDEESEIVVDHFVEKDFTASNYGVKVVSRIPDDVNDRLTRIAYYIRFDKTSDYEMFQEFYLSDPRNPFGDAYATEGTLTGIFLASRIGTVFDPIKKDYALVQGIKARTLEAGYSIAIAKDNPAFVQYCAIGGGKIMKDIFYYEAELEVNGILNTKALVGTGGKIFIISETDTKVLNIEGSTGQPIFVMLDTMEYGVDKREDAVEVQGGVILNTPEGIYLTNGFEREWISEAINDICIDNYTTSRIYYNSYSHELYYFPISEAGFYYLFNFRRRKWEARDIKNFSGIKDLIIFDNGNIGLLGVNHPDGPGYYKNDITEKDFTAIIESPLSNIDSPEVEKQIDFIDIDYTGEGEFYIFDEKGKKVQGYNLNASERTTERLYVKLENRFPIEKLKYKLVTKDKDFAIFGIKFELIVTEKDGGYGAIPKIQTQP